MNQSAWKAIVLDHQDIAYQQFHSNLVPGKELIGVRTPDLEQIAKQILKEEPLAFLNEYQKDCYELDVIYGFVMAKAKLSLEERLSYCDRFISLIDNWAVCDLVCSRLKFMRKEDVQTTVLAYLNRHLQSDQPWAQRFVYVCLLDHFLNAEQLPLLFSVCEYPFQKTYYVQMAVAWLLSICFVKFPQETESYLLRSSLDDFTYNKAIQKACESTRVAKQQKQHLRTLKRKTAFTE